MISLGRVGEDLTPGRGAPRTLASAIRERLRSEILTADLIPGQKLHIALLAKRFDVSLAAVREALSRLVSDGLVEAVDQRGFRVRPVSPRDLEDLTRTRIDIEGLALRKSIANGDKGWEAAVRAAHQRLAAAPRIGSDDPARVNESWATLHREFHETLVGACGSAWLRSFRTILYEQSERYRRLSVPLAQANRDVEAEHQALAEAVLARDVGRALDVLADHFQRTTDIILAADPVLLREDMAA